MCETEPCLTLALCLAVDILLLFPTSSWLARCVQQELLPVSLKKTKIISTKRKSVCYACARLNLHEE
jgi:hypothetical protein